MLRSTGGAVHAKTFLVRTSSVTVSASAFSLCREFRRGFGNASAPATGRISRADGLDLRAPSPLARHSSSCAARWLLHRNNAPGSASSFSWASTPTQLLYRPPLRAEVARVGTIRAVAKHRASVSYDTPTATDIQNALIARGPPTTAGVSPHTPSCTASSTDSSCAALHEPSPYRHHAIGDATTNLTRSEQAISLLSIEHSFATAKNRLKERLSRIGVWTMSELEFCYD